MTSERAAGSYRDPGGFLYWLDNTLYRQINHSAAESFQAFMDSGLCTQLQETGLLIPHTQADISLAATEEAAHIIAPEPIEHISYPYEWCFSQLKDAALLTLEIQRQALEKDFCLKDATAYNVQFRNGAPIFIDTLSFDRYTEGKPWVAYGQFCRHFLAPLALMAYVDIGLSQLLRTNIDGIPLALAARMLPGRTRLSPGLAMHIWLHARSETRAHQQRDKQHTPGGNFSRTAFMGLIDSLTQTIKKLSWQPGGTEWHDYYEANNNYGDAGLEQKSRLVKEFVAELKPDVLWDLGGNTGRFSRIAIEAGARSVCFDIDPGCVESNYLFARSNNETEILPLLMDLGNPSPGLGWANTERMSAAERGPADTVLALGLVHHLAIGINVPFPLIAEYFRRLAPTLIVEFIPRGDSQIDKLLSTRADVFKDYEEDSFQEAFGRHFSIIRQEPIPGTKRTLYLMSAAD